MQVPRPPAARKTPASPKDKPPIAPGSAPEPEGDSGTALPLPHERDERMDVQPEPDPVVEQAGRDLAAGQVDTDLRATPGLDAEQRERLVRTPPEGGG